MINQNALAKAISVEEGLKESISIGQIKEVLRITLKLLAREDSLDVLKLLDKHK